MLSLTSDRPKTLHPQTKANAILYKKKGLLQVLYSPSFHYYMTLFFYNPSWCWYRFHSNIQTKLLPNCKSFSGQWEMYSLFLHVHFVVIKVSLSTVFLWIPFWATFGLVCRSDWKTALLLIKGISFHQVPHIHRAWPTHSTWGFSNHTLVQVKVDYCLVFSPWLEVTGFKEKRNHILSISAANI